LEMGGNLKKRKGRQRCRKKNGSLGKKVGNEVSERGSCCADGPEVPGGKHAGTGSDLGTRIKK